MYSRTYNLCVALGEDSVENENLIISRSLYKLDQYISKNYRGREDVKKKFDQKIGEFCLSNMERIQYENQKNGNNRFGDIVLLEKTYDKEGNVIDIKKIKLIYKNHFLPARRTCISKIKKILQNDKKLFELRKRKYYLLSQNEMDLIDKYKRRGLKKDKDAAISCFISRIKTAKSSEAYYYCRSLSNLCDLIKEKVKTSKGCVKNISRKMPEDEIKLESKPENYSSEFIDTDDILKDDEFSYLETLIEDNNDEELYNLYGLEEIEKMKEGKKHV